VAAITAGALGAQPAPARPAFSIGQPSLWPQHAALLAPVGGDASTGAVWLAYGVHRALVNPVTGLFGLTGEGYAAVGGNSYGARLFGEVKALGVSAGVDWNAPQTRFSPLLSFQTAVRRGGVVGRGTMVRVDWLPTRSQTVALGLSVPTFQPLAGRTRPRRTHVDLDDVRTAASNAAPSSPEPSTIALRDLSTAASEIAAFSNAYSARAETIVARSTGSYRNALKRYDAALRKMFGTAAADSASGLWIARHARATLLDDVLMPIDSLFGQAKENPRDLGPLIRPSVARMIRWLRDSTALGGEHRDAVARAYASWLDIIEHVNAEMFGDVGDSRLVWLPLELSLTADQFADQGQVDSLLARAVGHPFSDQNALTYLRSSDLPLEIARSIYAARDYHALWTHDFTGRTATGAIDNIGFSMVADAYLPALTAAVNRYDSTGVLPTYVILQDEFFYEPRDNRLWMDILEDPLHASIRLRGDTTTRESQLRRRRDELRVAVAASSRLQRDARSSGDPDDWIRRMVKVHVNIVEPTDFSFRSSHSIPGIQFTPDNIERDHRKLVVYDVNEADPYRGAMLVMGIGIGEHYASATWEDRGYRVRGPATLEARNAVRQALLRNGLREDHIPPPLRAVANVLNTERRTNAGDYVGRAMQVNNEVGFAVKESSVARAMLYNLAPPGSEIIVPDPMWMSRTWAGMLAGAAARGCRVVVVAPATANAPSPQAPLMALQHDVLSRLLALRTSLAPRIDASDGELRVGIFAAGAEITDATGRLREIRQGLQRAPWIHRLVPFDSQTRAVLERAEVASANSPNATALAHDAQPRAPQLHQKSQFIARPGAISALVGQPGWDVILAQNIRARAEQTARFAEQLGYSTPNVDTTATRSTDAMLRGYERSLPESDRRRVSFYFSLGSQNQDDRGIVSDGETTLIVSGVAASAGLVDLYFLMARSTWITTEAELQSFNPKGSSLMRRIAHLLAAAF